MNLKLVSWDVYGTIIAPHLDECSDCGDKKPPLRPNVLEALSLINETKLSQITSSDGHLGNLKNNLLEVGIFWKDYFEDLYKFEPGLQKDFSYILDLYRLRPQELLVIGDNYDLDLSLALSNGCNILHTPEERDLRLNELSDLIK